MIHEAQIMGVDMSITLYGAKAFTDVLKGAIRDIRPAWLMEELEVAYERVVLDPMKKENKTPEYLKLNPTGKIPTIVDGSVVLFESAAICEYIAEKEGALIPESGTAEYYECRQWNYWIVSNMEPQCGRVFGADFFYDKGAVTDGIREMAVEALPRFLAPLNERLGKNQFMLGSEFSVTDILLVTTLNSIKHTPILNDYPNIKRHFDECTSRPAFVIASSQNGY